MVPSAKRHGTPRALVGRGAALRYLRLMGNLYLIAAAAPVESVNGEGNGTTCTELL